MNVKWTDGLNISNHIANKNGHQMDALTVSDSTILIIPLRNGGYEAISHP